MVSAPNKPVPTNHSVVETLRRSLQIAQEKKKILFWNNITRSLNSFGINKTDVSYCLLSNTSALLSKTKWLLESKAEISDNKQ